MKVGTKFLGRERGRVNDQLALARLGDVALSAMDLCALCRNSPAASPASIDVGSRDLRCGICPVVGRRTLAKRHSAGVGHSSVGAHCCITRVRGRHVLCLDSGERSQLCGFRHRQYDRREPLIDRRRMGGCGVDILVYNPQKSRPARARTQNRNFIPGSGYALLLFDSSERATRSF
jgi:hypothetical protein